MTHIVDEHWCNIRSTMQGHDQQPTASPRKGMIVVLVIGIVGLLFFLGLQIARLLLR